MSTIKVPMRDNSSPNQGACECPFCGEDVWYNYQGEDWSVGLNGEWIETGDVCKHYVTLSDDGEAEFEPGADDNGDPPVYMSRKNAKDAGATFKGEK